MGKSRNTDKGLAQGPGPKQGKKNSTNSQGQGHGPEHAKTKGQPITGAFANVKDKSEGKPKPKGTNKRTALQALEPANVVCEPLTKPRNDKRKDKSPVASSQAQGQGHGPDDDEASDRTYIVFKGQSQSRPSRRKDPEPVAMRKWSEARPSSRPRPSSSPASPTGSFADEYPPWDGAPPQQRTCSPPGTIFHPRAPTSMASSQADGHARGMIILKEVLPVKKKPAGKAPRIRETRAEFHARWGRHPMITSDDDVDEYPPGFPRRMMQRGLGFSHC